MENTENTEYTKLLNGLREIQAEQDDIRWAIYRLKIAVERLESKISG